ncbi:hypothetical protein [Teredinibacter purpureus]|nr:hypothetical protein [Teredinibacter purpureus]
MKIYCVFIAFTIVLVFAASAKAELLEKENAAACHCAEKTLTGIL